MKKPNNKNNITMDLVKAKELKVPAVPRIAKTMYSNDFDTPFYLIDAVTDYHADPSGNEDSTDAIQTALDATALVGGGIVFLPAGQYRLTKTIRVPQNVTLRGDWKRPTDTDKTVAGTILYIEHGAGTTGISGPGLDDYPGGASVAILLKGQAGLRNLSVYYPHQNLSNGKATPYPFSIDSVGQFPTVRNITLVNSYDGMYFGVHNKGVSFPNAICVYGSPLRTGWVSDQTVATPRYEHISFGPRYWAESGLLPSGGDGTMPSAAAIKQAMRTAGAVGFVAGWGCGGGVYVSLCLDGYDVGILTTSTQSSRLVNVFITDCRVGMDMAFTKGHGWVLTNGKIIAEEAAVRMRDECCHLALNAFELMSTKTATVIDHQAGVLTLTRCTLRHGECGTGYAIKSDDDSDKFKYYFLSVVGCHFEQEDQHISLGRKMERAVVYGNTYGSSKGMALDISNKSEAPTTHIVIDNNSTSHKFAEFEPIGSIEEWLAVQRHVPPPPAGTSHVFNVEDHGANGQDTDFDNTASFQATLDLAGHKATKESGCIVYVPTGVYRIQGVLRVPSDVELRGSHDGGFCEKPRSILCFFEAVNKNRLTQIQLSEDSGIRGLVIFRPDQTWDGTRSEKPVLKEYPFAVKGTNRNWAYDLVLGNTYNGLDFSAGGGHALEYVHGCTLNRLIKLGSSGELSVAYNIQCKDQFWRTLGTRWNPEFLVYVNSHLGDGVPDSVPKSEGLGDIGTGMILEGTGKIRLLSHFVNRSADGLYVIKGSPKVRMYVCGGEGKGTGMYLRGDDSSDNMHVEIIGNSYHTDGEAYTISNIGLGDELKIFNCKSYGVAKCGHIMRGKGKIVVQQEYRNRQHETTYLLQGEARGIYEGGFLEAGATNKRVDVSGESHAVICAVLTHRDQWKFAEKGNGTIEAVCLCPNTNGGS